MYYQSDEKWLDHFNLYKEYISSFFLFPTANLVYKERNIGNWFYNQIHFYKTGALREDRKKMLDAITPLWCASYEERCEECMKLKIESNWKENISVEDISIDNFFKNEELYACLCANVYSVREYFNGINSESEKLPRNLREILLRVSCNENRKRIFKSLFPRLDYDSFKLSRIFFIEYDFLATVIKKRGETDGKIPSFYDLAQSLNEFTRFETSEEMRKAYDCFFTLVLTEQEKTVLYERWVNAKTFEQTAYYMKATSGVEITRDKVIRIERKAIRKLGEVSSLEFFKKYMVENDKLVAFEKEILEQQRLFNIGHLEFDDLDLSVRTYNCLKRAGITSLIDLIDMTKSEFMKMRNLGLASYNETIAAMERLGISFKNEIDDTFEDEFDFSLDDDDLL